MGKTESKIIDLKPGIKVKFPVNYEKAINNFFLNIGGAEGIVLEGSSRKEVSIKLSETHEQLNEWDNVAIFDEENELQDKVYLLNEKVDLSDIELESEGLENFGKRWRVIWLEPMYEKQTSIVSSDLFSENKGFSEEEISDILSMKVSDVYTKLQSISIMRVEDGEPITDENQNIQTISKIEESDMKDFGGRSLLSISEVLFDSEIAWHTASRKIKGKTIITFEAKGGEDITYILIFKADNQLSGVNFVWGTEDLAEDEKIKDFFIEDSEMNSCIVQTDGLFNVERTIEEINKIAFNRANDSNSEINIEGIKVSLTMKYGKPESGTANWSVPAWRVCDLKNCTDKNCGVFVVLDDDDTFSVLERRVNEDDEYEFDTVAEKITDEDELLTEIFSAVSKNTKNAKEKKVEKSKILPLGESARPTAQEVNEFLEKEVIVNEEEIELIKLVLENQIKKYDELISSAIGSEIKQSIMKERTKMNSIIDKIRNRSSLS